jgi:hypothetical protein
MQNGRAVPADCACAPCVACAQHIPDSPALASEIVAGRKPGNHFSAPEARNRTGLCRKLTLPPLNRKEKGGHPGALQNERVVR